ncbi:MAG: DMT family transporter [Calditrichaeota bacterium]|nr:MAG: DMT family transporter [Calditrichota bacterium]
MNVETIPYIGEIMAVSTAIIWAFSVIMFKKSGETVHPIGLNLFKNFIAVILLVPTLWIINESIIKDIPSKDYLYIFLSGALGIGIADTFFFLCLNRLGAGLTAIVDCLYSPFVIGFSFLMLGEVLSILQFFGVLLIISAVLTATYQGNGKETTKRDKIIGVLFGVCAMLLTGFGVVLVKPVLENQPLLWVTEMRLFSGLLILLIVLLFRPNRKKIVGSIYKNGLRMSTLFGSILGAYFAMILWLGGMKYTLASTAAALNQTSNIFIFIFAFLILKEKITVKSVIGIVLAVAGAFMVTFGA